MKRLTIVLIQTIYIAFTILLTFVFTFSTYGSYASVNETTNTTSNTLPNGLIVTALTNTNTSYILSNPDFILLDNQSGLISQGLPSFWNDTEGNCVSTFKCTANFVTGWEDNTSLQISTMSNINETWSEIHSKDIDVNPNEQYDVVTHMKLNEFANQSHTALEAFNETSGEWYQFEQCPSGIDGPLEWQVSSCEVTIPANATKIRLVLNAGWSSQQNREAVTFFDAINMTKFDDITDTSIEIKPVINDPNLKAEMVFEGLNFPTSMAFLGPDDILVLEKEKGTVQRIVNGQMLPEPLLDINVATKGERGMLGIAISKSQENTYVFLYYTEAQTADGEDISEGEDPLGNRLYRYELINNTLTNGKLLVDIPGSPGFYHQGGSITVGPDGNLYVVTGDVDHRTEAQNVAGEEVDGTSGILKVGQDGRASEKGFLGDVYPLNLYYAYGIRNSYGIDFDPLTGNLWDTENGPFYGDEINLVEPGFNSGWVEVQGIWKPVGEEKGELNLNPDNLTDFDGRGKYSTPEFIWEYSVGLSALKFFDSDRFGPEYENGLFVGNVNEQALYHFDLTENRTKLDLDGELADGIIENPNDLKNKTVGERLGRITDIEVGPDGYLYVLSHRWHRDPGQIQGTIFRISPMNVTTTDIS